MINRIQNKHFCLHYVCVLFIYVYIIHTHACIYFRKICLYIKYNYL